MAKALSTIKAAAEVVRDETTIGANTAVRVGGLFVDVVNYLANVSAVKVIGALDSVSDLPATASIGDGYYVGDDLYVYVGENGNYSNPAWTKIEAMQGVSGDDGVGISSITITESSVSGGTNVVTITLTNGSTYTFNVLNGTAGTAFAWADDTSDQTNWDTTKTYIVPSGTDNVFNIYYYEDSAWNVSSETITNSMTIVNDLTTGGTAVALSAEQGKILNEQLNGAEAVVVSGEGSATISSTSFSKWMTITLNGTIPQGATVYESQVINNSPTGIYIYENSPGTSNQHNMQKVTSSDTFTAKNDITKFLIYGTGTTAGDVSFSFSCTASEATTGLADDVEDLQTAVQTIEAEIGEADSEVSGTGSITISSTSFSRYFDVTMPSTIPSGSIVSVSVTTDATLSRLVAYENSPSIAQHELAHTTGTTLFTATANITKFLVYGTASAVGDLEVTFTFTEEGSGLLKEVGDMSADIVSPLNGMKMAFLGSSITQGKAWVGLVADAFGSEYVNCGVSGTAIVNESDASLSNPKRLTGEYSKVTDPITGDVTVNGIALPTDSKIIFIEGGVNDWARNWALGTKKLTTTDGVIDVDDQTFYGACHQAIYNILQRCPDAILIIIGDVFGKLPNRSSWTDSYGLYNNQDLTCIDYGDALVEIAGMWGARAFNFGRYVGINDLNVMEYGDGLHPDGVYCQRIANAIINFLKEIKGLEVITS